MTLPEIDEALHEWQGKIAAASENLLLLEDLPVVRRLRPDAGRPAPTLTGRTAAEVLPALALLPGLFQDIGLLADVVDRAERLRRPLNALWHPERVLEQIEDLLRGPSAALPAVQTPFARRGLLSPAEQEQARTPAALLALMSGTFADVKATLLKAQDAWAGAERALQAAQDKAAALEGRAASLGETNSPDLVEIRRRLEQWAQQIATDPLGLPARADREVAELLRQARERLEVSAAARARATVLQGEARALLAHWADVHQKAESARAECAARLFPVPPPGGPSRLPELRGWLATLENALAQRHGQAAGVGLEHWLQTARACLEQELRTAEACVAALELAEELPGRFAALGAKARARGLASRPALVRAGQDAEAVLRQKPLPLPQAERAVTAYADTLQALLRKKP